MSLPDLLIHSKKCWLDNTLQEATIVIEKERIVEVYQGQQDLSAKLKVYTGEALLMPGVIDAHIHINEPGRTHWEGFKTATIAAAAGGTTTLIDMPLNATPVTVSRTNFSQKIDAAKGKLKVNCGFYGGLVPDNLKHLTALIEAGVLGIKAFLTHSGIEDFPNVSQADLEKGMAVLADYDIPLLVHCELSREEAFYKKALHEHPQSYAAYLASRPKKWENEAIQLIIELCRKYPCKVHIVHLSSAEALDAIRNAKKEGLPITVETCPQYILFDAEEILNGNTLYKCAPPIREAVNNQKLITAISEGLIDFITTDHSPAPPDLKELESGNFSKAWGGVSGLQFLLSASWTALKDHLPIEKFIPLLTEHPARFLNLHHRKGKIAPGYDADLVVWNPEAYFTVLEKDIQHRHKATPYLHKKLFGKVHQTFVNGRSTFKDGKISDPLPGKVLLNKKS